MTMSPLILGPTLSCFRICLEQREDKRASRRARPAAWPDATPDELAASVDEVERGRAPDPVDLSGDLPALIEEDGGDVAPLLNGSLDQFRVLPEADHEHLEALALKVRVELVDGRQLLPAVRSPGGPEVEQDHLAPEALQADRLPLEVRKREGGRGRRGGVGLNLHPCEVRP